MIKRIFLAIILAMLTVRCSGGGAAPPTPPLPPTPSTPAIRIALLSPTSGEMATFGRMARSGSMMALDEWNDRGGVLNHHLEWTIYNSDCTFEAARQAAEAAIAAGFDFIIGPLCSDAAIGAATAAEAAQVLMIAPTATHPLVTVNEQGQPRPTVFRAGYAYPWQGRAAGRFACDTLQARRAALFVDPGDDYTTSLADAFADQFVTQGGEVVYRANYDPATADFGDGLRTSLALEVEVIYLPAAYPVVNRLAGQWQALTAAGLSPTVKRPVLLGSDSWQADGLDRSSAVGSYYTVQFAGDDPRPATQAWREAYKAVYAIEPDTLAALDYDAAAMLLTAIEQAGTTEPIMVAEVLAQTTFAGVTGPISFDQQHNPIKPVPLVRIEEGGVTFALSVLP